MTTDRPAEKRATCLPEDVELRPATRADDRFLYRLLEERYANPDTNIEGMALPRLPTYEEHVRFLDTRPYPELHIVVLDGRDVGMIFLNEERAIGCFVLAEHHRRGVGVAASYVFLRRCGRPVYAYVNPRNRASWRGAERLGFVRVEETSQRLGYVLLGPPADPFDGLRGRRAAPATGDSAPDPTRPAPRPGAAAALPPPTDVQSA